MDFKYRFSLVESGEECQRVAERASVCVSVFGSSCMCAFLCVSVSSCHDLMVLWK